MINFESYKDNLSVTDKNGIKNIPVNKKTIYSGPLKNIINKKNEGSPGIPPLAAAVIGLNNTNVTVNNTGKPDCWTDFDAQENYLKSKPTCYIILGKPGAGAYTLGEAMSKKLNCIHLCPKNIIVDEMEQNSTTGICIGFNLRQQKVIKYDCILSILKKKLESPAVKHRGYVLSGLPLISSSKKSHYLSNTLYSEDGMLAIDDVIYELLVNLKKKKSKKPSAGAGSPHPSESTPPDVEWEEEEAEEEQEPEETEEEAEELVVELPKFILDTCSDIIYSKKPCIYPKQKIFLEQFETILNLPIDPDVIIYLTCPDMDLVTKRNHEYYSYTNNIYTFDAFPPNIESELRWPEKSSLIDYTSPYDSHIFNPKYNCRQPLNFCQQSTEQMCNYRKYVLPFVEKKLKDFNPKNIVKIDARNSVHQMMHHVNEALIFLSIKPVLIPEPLYLEEPPEDMEEFWKLVEELNVIRSGAISFNRYPSLWQNRCPVELMKRRSQIGNPKLAVTLFKHVYLLSSLDDMIAFCRNPRPYLQLKYLAPTCRVIIIGTPTSGKTMIAHCLSWLFDTPIMTYQEFVEGERGKKYNTYATTILSEIIATIEDDRLLKWQNQETERKNGLMEWNNTNFSIFQSYVKLFLEVLKFSKREQITEEDEITPESEEPDSELLANFNYFKNLLSFLPFIEDIDECMNMIQAKTLVQFAPSVLTNATDKPATPALGDPDVMVAITNYIAANDLQNEIEPTLEELMNEMVKVLSDRDEETLKSCGTYNQFIIDGFPSDPECWGYLSDAKLIPDHTICLIENREIEPELVQYYAEISKCPKNYGERIALANDSLIKTKCLTKPFPDASAADMRNIVSQSMATILDTIFIEQRRATVEVETPAAEQLTAAIEKFREDWDSVKLKIEENSKLFIEIELENKTDLEVIDDVLLNMRKNYFLLCEVGEDEESELQEDEDETPIDFLTFNDPRNLCETNIYCPIAYYNHGVLWEGKPELNVKYNNKMHWFTKEECLALFQKDVSCFQQYNKPFKPFSPLRLCVIGCIGSGKTTISKLIAKELGLLHIDFSEIINTLFMPKHFKKVGRQYENIFTDVSIDEEGVMEFQMDEENENLASDMLGNETELRRMVYNYLERGSPILSILMQRLVKKLWFEKPFVETGFVLDGFPRLPSDVEDMVACFAIPDLIIEIEGSSESMLERLSQKMYKTWRIQLNEAKHKAKLKLDQEIQEWMNFITKNVVAKLLIEDIFDNLFSSVDEPRKVLSGGSVIMDANPQGSSNVDVNLFSFYNDMVQEYPSPVDLSEWEKPDDARERIDGRLEAIYEVDDEGIQSLKDVLLEQRIKTISINGTKPLNKVLRNVLYKLTNLRNRCGSLFEQTFVIGNDIAEMLLFEGFFCFSKFGRMCPVYIFENPNSISNPYKIMKRKGKVFPVIHRAYIYFIFGEDGVRKFRTDPLKYASTDNMKSFIEYPITISVIGPPKSGKTVLANKLAKRYGLIYISRGIAVRYILEQRYWTELGSQMRNVLSKGDCVNTEQIMKAVQTVAIDHRSLTYGFVFDGFPEFASEATELANIGLYPNTIFDISNNKELIIKNAMDEIYYDIIKRKPPYSAPYIEYRFTNWSKKSYQVRHWVQQDVQNLCPINGLQSRWQCLQDASSYIDNTFPKIHYYLNNVTKKIVSPKCMCITDKVFSERMSHFNNLCPLCLQNNILRHSGHPIDKNGVVQYHNIFYWICSNHINAVLKHPERYLLEKKCDIPEIPAVVKTVNITFVYENGICIVTYAQNLPQQIIKMGSHLHAASYNGKTYMFCSAACLDMFMAKPHLYHDITVFKETKTFPKLSLRKLPNIGYLEQTIGNIITDACCSVNASRPKYPGLDIKVSGALYIGLYLKTHNPRVNELVLPLYDKASKIYDARCKLIFDIGLRLRSMDNPFAYYPKCCDKTKYLNSREARKLPSKESLSVTDAISEFPRMYNE